MKMNKSLITALACMAFQFGAKAATINFDALDATSGPVSGATLASYLAQWGVTISGVTPGSQMLVLDDRNVYGGGIIVSPSGHNTLHESQNGPIHFTLNFSVPQSSVSFTRAGLGATLSSFTAWSAHAFNASNIEVSTASEGTIIAANLPPRTFTLTGPGITSVRWDANNVSQGFSSIVMDDLVLPQAVQANFYDDFESAFLNPFWTKTEVNGLVAFPSTNRANSGRQSLELQATLPFAPQQQAEISHTFPTPTYGTVSVWVYDTMVGIPLSDYIWFTVRNSQTGSDAWLQTQNYHNDFGANYFYQINNGNNDSVRTSIPRSSAWHHWVISALRSSLTLSIDGTSVYQGEGGLSFDSVRLILWGGTHPSYSVQFDDFQFVAEPPPAPVLSIRTSQVELFWNSISNWTYRVDYKSALTTNSWTPLVSCVRATNSTTRVLDAVLPDSPQRFYRVVSTNCVPLP